MSLVSRLARYRQQHITEGPISNMRPADKRKITRLVQRGQAPEDGQLVPQAIAYANFRARVSRVLALFFLVLAALEAAAALFSSFGRIFYAVVCAGFLAIGLLWLGQVGRYRRAAQAMTQARTS